METVIPGLYASSPEPLPFGPALEIRAYLLQREQGNLLVESLELVRGLDFDVLVPSMASAGQPYYAFVDRGEAERRIDAILDRAPWKQQLIAPSGSVLSSLGDSVERDAG
jgi:hypothetical protein